MKTDSATSWQPTTAPLTLKRRAALLAQTRKFFADRGVLEVDTPMVVHAAVTDVHIHSARVELEQGGAADRPERSFFLHTSPEYAMKRLLAAGSGDIYQICHVVRALERSDQHNAEFTLVEWYREGYSLDALMSEVAELVLALLSGTSAPLHVQRISYREAFLSQLQLDPFTARAADLVEAATRTVGFHSVGRELARDELLELLMGAYIGPRLGQDALTFVHGYPATQAALARLDSHDPRTALRFELYCRGIELANGFQELASSAEQRMRFEQDNDERRRRGLPVIALDERLLAALEHGLAACAGVALGFDRLVMLATGCPRIDEVVPFPIERA